MCFVGVSPPGRGLKRAGGLRTPGEELRSYTPMVAPSLLIFVWTAAGPIFCFPGSLPAFAEGERLGAVHGSLVSGVV